VEAPTLTVGAGVEPLARALRAMATELERDPALARRVADAMQTPGQTTPGATPATTTLSPARAESSVAAAAPTTVEDEPPDAIEAGGEATLSRVNRTFHPRIVTGTPLELGAGVPDPFALAQRLGEAGLRAALADLRLGSLRAIVREHRLDPKSHLVGVNDAAKFRSVIVEAIRTAGATEAAPPRQPARKGRKANQ